MLTHIRAISFDWGDTLASNVGMPYLATQRRVFATLADGLARLGGTPPANAATVWMDALKHEWEASIDPQRNPDEREFDFDAMANGWVAASGLDPLAPQVVAVLDAIHDRLTDTVLPFSETAPVLRELSRRGYRLGILSHVPWVGTACRRWFHRHELATHLSFYSLSCEVGRIKPHPAHFYDAIRQAGVEPQAILHVGDHPRRDIHGARKAGLRTCLRRTERVYPESDLDACGADLEILHLAELLDHLPPVT